MEPTLATEPWPPVTPKHNPSASHQESWGRMRTTQASSKSDRCKRPSSKRSIARDRYRWACIPKLICNRQAHQAWPVPNQKQYALELSRVSMTIGCSLHSERKRLCQGKWLHFKKNKNKQPIRVSFSNSFYDSNEQRRIQNHSHRQDTDIIDYVQRKGAWIKLLKQEK